MTFAVASFSVQGLNGVVPDPSQLGKAPWKAVPEPKPVLGVAAGVDPKPPLVPNPPVPVVDVPKPDGLAPPKTLPPVFGVVVEPKPPVEEPNPPVPPKPPVLPAVWVFPKRDPLLEVLVVPNPPERF